MKKLLLIRTLIFIILLLSPLGASPNHYFDRSINLKIYEEFPKILDEKDLNLYYKAYLEQKNEMYNKADRTLSQLDNDLLLGYMLYIRYTRKNYNPTYQELKAWLELYHKIPVAPIIYQIAQKKATNISEKLDLKNPNTFFHDFTPIYALHPFFKNISPSIDPSQDPTYTLMKNNITKKIKSRLKEGNTLSAKNIMINPKTLKSLNPETYDYYCYLLGKNYFLDGRDDYAIEWLNRSLRRTPSLFPESFFTLGLAYFRKKDYAAAKKSFYKLFLDPAYNFSPHMISKSSYWYARVSFITGDIQGYLLGLKISSKYIYNFYGIIAAEELGIKPQYSWTYFQINPETTFALKNTVNGQRALALLQLGLLDWAEQELVFLFLYNMDTLNDIEKVQVLDALMYFAQSVPMPALGYKLAGENGKYYGLSHFSYPVLPTQFYENFNTELNPLLVMALIKRESSFLSGIVSNVGATGLMQMMPQTAEFVIKKFNLDPNLSNPFFLTSPKNNIKIGKKYVRLLLDNPEAHDNLIYVLAGFNGGFNNVTKWKQQKFRNSSDPLFFIESIPFHESRNYVKSVITDYWIYQYKAGLDPYSLYSIAQGNQPIYVGLSQQDITKLKSFKYSKATNENIYNFN